MTVGKSFLSNEQLRFIRRSSHSKIFKPDQIFHMLDIIHKLYTYQRNSLTTSYFERSTYEKYEHDVHYVLGYFPYLDVHSYMASLNPKFMDSFYKSLERMEINYGKFEDMSDQNKAVYNRYLAIRDFIPVIKSQIIISM